MEMKMKKILDGTPFDTDKAVEIGTAKRINGLESWVAILYRTPRSRRYFLAGAGGPMTRFGQSGGRNVWGSGGFDIIPLPEVDALKWAETYLEQD